MKLQARTGVLWSLILAAVLVAGIFGPLHMGMAMNEEPMNDCPFMGAGSLCLMDAFGHIDEWQKSFVAVPQYSLFLSLLLSIGSVFFGLWALAALAEWQRFVRQTTHSKTVEIQITALRRHYARGLLNPKAY